jgi:hypothetical protein
MYPHCEYTLFWSIQNKVFFPLVLALSPFYRILHLTSFFGAPSSIQILNWMEIYVIYAYMLPFVLDVVGIQWTFPEWLYDTNS